MDTSPVSNGLRVLIVADDPLARAGLAALLADQRGYVVAGQIPSQADLQDDLAIYRPDVIVWDLGWNASRAMEHLADLRGGSPPIVALISDPSDAAEVWSAGARGILLRDASSATLLAALRAVYEGLMVLAPELSAISPSNSGRETPPLSPELTPREMEVLKLMAEGLPNKGIAQRLRISEHTVKFHVNAVMGKLSAQSRTEAVTTATRMGLILL